MRISTNGPVSNTGIAMQILGARISFIGKTCDDFIGEAILSILKNKVSVGGIKIEKCEYSSYTIVITPKKYRPHLFAQSWHKRHFLLG